MKEKLIEYLNNRIAECDSSASELFLERDYYEDGDWQKAKAEAYKEILDFINQIPE